MNSKSSELQDFASRSKGPAGICNNIRFVLMIMSGLSTGLMFLCRLNFAVAIVSMVNHTELNRIENENKTIPEDEIQIFENDGEFIWSHEIQQTIISSYMIAYTFPQVLATSLSNTIGPRYTVLFGLILNAVSTGLTPILAYWGWPWIILLRSINGIGGSVMLAMNLHVIEKWMPINESTTSLILVQFVCNGFSIICPLVVGYLSAIHWKWAFYIPMITTLAFCFLWYLVIRDDIIDSPAIGEMERNYIVMTRPPTLKNASSNSGIDWGIIFKSDTFYFCCLCWITFEIIHNSFFINLMPDYLNKTMNLTPQQNGFYNFVIQLGGIVSMIFPQYFILLFIDAFKLNLSNSRKLTYFLINLLATVPLIYIAMYNNNQVLGLIVAFAFHTSNEIIMTATLVTKFGPHGVSSMVYSLMNTVGCLTIAPSSWLSGTYLDLNGASFESWANLFYLFIVINIINMTIYLLFIDSKPVGSREDLSVDIDSKVAAYRLESMMEVQNDRKSSLTRQISVCSGSLCLNKMAKD